MKRSILSILSLLIGLNFVLAQQDSTQQEAQNYRRATYFRTTSQVINTNLGAVWLPNMQRFLREEELAKNLVLVSSVPFEAGVRIQDWFYSVHVALPLQLTDDSRTRLTTATLMVEHSVFKSRNYRLNLGLGASLYEYSFALLREEPELDVALQDLGDTRFLSSPDIKTRGGAFDLSVSLINREKKKIALANCFRLGYRLGFGNYGWKSDFFTLRDAPKDRMNMLYFSYLISISRNQ